MPGGAALTALACDAWLVAQVERARQRSELPALAVRCPAAGVVEAARGDGAPIARLSGFAPGDPWVGAALVALVETRSAVDAAWSSAPAPPAEPEPDWRFLLVPSLLYGGGAAQVGGDVIADLRGLRLAVGATRAARDSNLGAVEAVDLTAGVGVAHVLAPLGALRLVVTPSIAAGASVLTGSAAGSAIAVHSSVAAVGRATLDLGLETHGSSAGLAFGLRVGFRLGPAVQADHTDVLAGTGALVGGYVAIGWTP